LLKHLNRNLRIVSETFSEETVRRMVRHVHPEWSVREPTVIGAGTDTLYDVTVDTGDERRRCILKVCTEVPPPDFRPEPYLLSALAQRTSVPGPRPLGAVEEHDDLPAPF
jgi:hypothetical protein